MSPRTKKGAAIAATPYLNVGLDRPFRSERVRVKWNPVHPSDAL